MDARPHLIAEIEPELARVARDLARRLRTAERPRELRREGADLVKTRREELPVGLDVEVFRGEALLRADREASDPRHREHVGPYVYEHPELFRVCPLPYGGEPWPSCRLTLDYPEDLAFVRAVYGALSPGAPAAEVRRYLAQNPQVCAINGFRDHG